MSLFDEVCDLDPAAQAAAVTRLAAEDEELARRLCALLRHDQTRSLGPDLLDIGVGAAVAALPPPGVGPLAVEQEGVEMISLLGEGGMGRVMLARQRSLRREVAAKVLRRELVSEAGVAGLVSEALLLGALEHPNIVPVHVLCRDERGLPILLMKRVEGVPWATLIQQPEHPAWAQIQGGGGDRLPAHLSILRSICNALRFAHSRGVIHRDVKPDNVMVGPFGEVYLLDWGIAARLGAESPVESQAAVSGTPGYMAPEMLSGAAPDARTDVYLLGATLHYVLTRTPRHRGRTLAETLEAARASLPHPYGPEVPEELAALCNRATSADPAARQQSAQAFLDEIDGYLRHRDAVALAEAAEERLRQALAAGPEPEPGPIDRRRMHDLMTECHFGFRQSLRAWPENPLALRGLGRCLEVLIDQEIAQGNLARVEALLEERAELGPPPPEIMARAAALRQEAREKAAREARLRAIDRAQDWSIAARQRALFSVLAAVMAVGVWRLVVRDQAVAPHPIPPLHQALVMGGGLCGLGVLVYLFRRHILATAVSRNLLLFVVCSVCGMTLSRALHALPAPTTAAAVSADQVLAATTAAIAALVLAPWIWATVPVFLCGALAARLWPSVAGATFGTSFLIALLLVLLLMWRRARRPGGRSVTHSDLGGPLP